MFQIGDRIVYPMHGAGIIVDVEIKEILGERREYFIIRMPIGDMKVMVPVSNVDDVGVRYIIGKEEIEGVMDILKGRRSTMPQNWNRRYRMNMDRIKTGDIEEIAAVVRNLSILDDEKGLSTGERKMLGNARQMLLSELVLASGKDMPEVEKLVHDAIRESENLDE
ncbi:CarD family transcriptional regulator [Gudongella oleilytica]|uniref:CarD family transcriptional regulator n=1 Tax=Gudongella oleilytica TaxID=1582259 RepID=UPI002A359C35|nr:CarD family transcriptional regulator [Gudongella oleilytica]MDY0256637.1 CarD family transcriptional regulator [Gudongella oleilytica]